MKVAIMQPYFFPYLGYFSIMKYTDKWIVLDEVQFIRHGWIERNRILKPEDGWQYISVPLEKHSRDTLIKEISIRNNENWKEKIFRQLEHYKKVAPYYQSTIEFLREALSFNTNSITQLNVHLMIETCKLLDIKINLAVFSEMELQIAPVKKPGDWALNISKAVNASEYVNPPGGVSLFDKKAFKDAKIDLLFLDLELLSYRQGERPFESALSMVDVLMFNTYYEINRMLDNYKII
ncbi:MAG: WbqC family protein [Bacteroidales bacterium]|nr:WbqC family protein [Bacteroidales bacterium]